MLCWLCICAIVVVCCRCVLHRLCSTTCMRHCKALGHTRPASMPGLSVGLPPQTKQGCLQSAAQSHCTMRWHKWLMTCTGASPQSKDVLASNTRHPIFNIYKRFIDRLTAGIACGAVRNLSLHFNDSDVFSRYLDL